MARLIDADALKSYIDCGHLRQPTETCFSELDVVRMLDKQQTIDAEPVRHGRVVWKNRFMGGFVPDITITDRAGEKHTGTLDTTHYEPVPYCSECGKELGVSSLAYCPNCGAKMDGGATSGRSD